MSNLDEDRIIMSTERSKYRSICRRKKRDFNRQEATKILNMSKNNNKEFWSQVSDKKSKCLPDINFHEHFKSLASRQSNLDEDGRAEVDSIILNDYEKSIDSLDSEFTMLELEIVLKSLKKNKSPGQDHILNEFLFNGNEVLKKSLLCLFNKLLVLEYFPTVWASGTITPIFKRGDKMDTNNYRGITLLSNISKIFTKLLNNRLAKWLYINNTISESQFGFREKKSTTDCIFILNGLLEILFAQVKKLYSCFFDYIKAFDLLDRFAVYYKLIRNGISSKMLNIIRCLYNQVVLSVKGDDTNTFYSNYGLLQGESLSPLMFSLFVNDLPDLLNNVDIGINIQDIIIKLLMFADDTVIFSETIEGLQKGIDSVVKYCKKWGYNS